MLCKGRGAVDARQVEYACASMHHDEYRKYLTSVDAGASLGASLRELASEAAACSVCAQLATHRRRLTEHDRVQSMARRSMQSESWFYTYLARLV